MCLASQSQTVHQLHLVAPTPCKRLKHFKISFNASVLGPALSQGFVEKKMKLNEIKLSAGSLSGALEQHPQEGGNEGATRLEHD